MEASPLKNDSLQLHLNSQQRDIIARAAIVKQTTMTNFILEKSYEAAMAILTEQSLFSLSDEQWDAFCSALEAPAKDIPALKNLLTQKSIFDEE